MDRSIYIFSSGQLSRKGNTICLDGEDGKRYLPVESVREILVFGEVSINKKLLEFLSQKEVLLHYFSFFGYYMGTFYPREHYNSGFMILRQAELYNDDTHRIELAKKFIEGSYKNIRKVLVYYKNRGKELDEVIEKIDLIFKRVEGQEKISQLMALEGNIRDIYYQSFDRIIEDTGFPFQRRSRRPPKNKLNTLISFGNSLLYTTILSEIYKTHLDPRIGYLHSTNFRSFTLNLDVSEVFKPIIVDRLIFATIDKGIIKGSDFDKKREGLILKEGARRRFVEQYDKKLKTTIKHRKLGRKVSYRRLIRMELYRLEKHIMGEEEYTPFVANW